MNLLCNRCLRDQFLVSKLNQVTGSRLLIAYPVITPSTRSYNQLFDKKRRFSEKTKNDKNNDLNDGNTGNLSGSTSIGHKSFRPTKHAIVLCHGLFGFDVIDFKLFKIHYWQSIKEFLETFGVKV